MKLEDTYVVELSGVTWSERGYLRGKVNGVWSGLNRATKFTTEEDAVKAFKGSAVEGPGALIKTDSQFKQWTTQYTI
jgi:hypothetical protein